MDGFIDERVSMEAAAGGAAPPVDLVEVPTFGSNPGALKMFFYAPPSMKAPPGIGGLSARPLVVVLHGCTQTAKGYDRAAGWTRLAERENFLVLLPQQQSSNNQQTCFSWFEPNDTRRDHGEVLSIRQMIDKAIDAGADPKRIYICGLSAGGAMANAMLVLYPGSFSRAAPSSAAFRSGRQRRCRRRSKVCTRAKIRDAKVWGDLVRAANPDYRGAWPTVSVWHGTADRTVKPINAGELVKQWTNVHGVSAEAPTEALVGRITRRIWRGRDDASCVTEYSVPDMGHGVPVDEAAPPAPFFLPAGLSATRQLAADWGLIGSEPDKRQLPAQQGLAR